MQTRHRDPRIDSPRARFEQTTKVFRPRQTEQLLLRIPDRSVVVDLHLPRLPRVHVPLSLEEHSAQFRPYAQLEQYAAQAEEVEGRAA
jgi:hypothetical protein